MSYKYYSYEPDANGDKRFGAKDKLPAGDTNKVIYGAEVDEEFTKIADGLREVERDVNTAAADLQDVKRTLNGIEEIEKGDKPGDTLYWDNPNQSWVHSGALQVQPGFGWSSQGDEVEINAELCVNSMQIQQGTGNALGMVSGRQGFQIRSYRYDNANDGWTGTTGNTWEILGLEARDNGAEPDRQNGIDLTADRVTIRNTRDYADPNWLDTQIMFRVDGKEVEIGTRNNSIDSFIVNCDTDFTNHTIKNVADPADDTCAVSKGYVESMTASLGSDVSSLESTVNSHTSTLNSHNSKLNEFEGELFFDNSGNGGSSRQSSIDAIRYVLDVHADSITENALKIQALENKPFEALKASSNFDEFKAAMIAVYEEMQAAQSEK
jgi:hypothetical protein